ncbi:MAG TPA: hypothetical protein VGL91_04990 [Acidobacteriota bacterium]
MSNRRCYQRKFTAPRSQRGGRLARSLILLLAFLPGCASALESPERLLRKYARVSLSYDDRGLSEKDRAALQELWQSADPIDRIFWKQVFPESAQVRQRLEKSSSLDDRKRLQYFLINYGPYDRIRDYRNFLEEGKRIPGAAFYPLNLTSLEFEEYVVRHPSLKLKLESPTTLVRRKGREFEAIAYEGEFAEELAQSASSLKRAADQCDSASLASYLRSRAGALVGGNYRESDRLWVSLRDEPLDIVIGPIEVSEDQLLGIKAAYEAAVLLHDPMATRDLNRLAGWADRFLPQAGFRRSSGEKQSTEVWQVALFAGGFNAGVKTVATTLPNDDEVRRELGTRKLIFSNVLRAKFEKVLRPLSQKLFNSETSKDVTETALFQQALLHESCHAFQAGENRKALGNTLPILDELKADLLALYVASQAFGQGLISKEELRSLQTSYMAGVMRACRLGVGSEYAQANAMALDALLAGKALVADKNGFHLQLSKLDESLRSLLDAVREIELRADYAAAKKLIEEKSRVPSFIQRRLIALDSVPVDVAFDYRKP